MLSSGMDDRLERLRRSLLDCPVIKRGDYDYFIHPLVDGIPFIESRLLDQVADEMIERAASGYERIVTVEAMGIPLGTAMSLKTGIPLSIIRKRPYYLVGEHVIDQSTGYSKGQLYINGLTQGMKVLLIDDVLSTGGTLRAVVTGLRETGVDIADIIILVEKSDIRQVLEQELGIGIKVLCKIEIENGRVVLLR
jgi:adenine phosphoribosyltransferase